MRHREAALLAGLVAFSSLAVLVLSAVSYSFVSSPGPQSALSLLMGMVLAYPVARISSRLDSIEPWLIDLYRGNRAEIALAVLLGVPSAFGFATGFRFPGSGLLNISFHASARVFMPVQNLYTGLAGESAGSIIFAFSRFYLHLTWTYLLSGLAVSAVEPLRGWMRESSGLSAGTLPFTGESSDIQVYVVTGFHGFLRVPESFCRECHLFVQAAEQAASESPGEIEIDVRSYWTRFAWPLLNGGYHPPVMLVNGELVAQGEEVPDSGEILDRIE